jgi:hypothetical protein
VATFARRCAAPLVVAVGVVILCLGGLILVAITLSRGGSTAPKTALGPPHFVDETAESGIEHTYEGDSSFAVGGGIAAFDCNGDGKPDLYIAGGSGPAALYRNDSPVGGALKFTRLPDPATDLGSVNGAYPIDIDGDGVVDLAVLRNGESVLLRGLGDCRFERANEAWSFNGGDARTNAFSATWEDSAHMPALALGHYLRPDGSYDCAENVLLRPKREGAGYAQATMLTPGFCSLSMLFSDWDRSGRRDLRVTNDRQYYVNGSDQLWRIAGESPRLYTDADGWVTMQIWGMGIASYDVTGRGYPDVFLTSQGDNKLQTLTAGPEHPTYRDIALKRGVTAAQPFTGGDVLPSTAWHPEFQDVNNDGFIDLFISKGNVSSMREYARTDPSNLLLGQTDGTFKESAEAAGILNYGRARGAALADFNLDGMLDLVEVNYGDRVRVWRNVGSGTAAQPLPMGNWLNIRPTQAGANRDAIGAWIEVQLGETTLRRELTIGGGHAGGQLGWTHFGLGGASNAQVRIQWPDGEMGPWEQLSANQFVTVERTTTRGAQPRHPGGK